jgi:hypothetical protein
VVVMRQRARKVSATHWVFEPPEDVPTAEEAYAVAWSDGLSMWLERWTDYAVNPMDLREATDIKLAMVLQHIRRAGAPIAEA